MNVQRRLDMALSTSRGRVIGLWIITEVDPKLEKGLRVVWS